jgi:hypothetical protein
VTVIASGTGFLAPFESLSLVAIHVLLAPAFVAIIRSTAIVIVFTGAVVAAGGFLSPMSLAPRRQSH